MKFPSKQIVEKVRAEYPVGTRVELVKMDDVQAPPVGTKGTVRGVDDTANILVDWDNGCGLNVVFNKDKVCKVDTVKTVCYGKEEVWDSRDEAMAFFLEGMISSEGSECERYTKIYTELSMGRSVCTDEEQPRIYTIYCVYVCAVIVLLLLRCDGNIHTTNGRGLPVATVGCKAYNSADRADRRDKPKSQRRKKFESL